MTKGCVSTKAGYAALTVSPGAPGTLHLNVEFKANDGQAVGCSYVLGVR